MCSDIDLPRGTPQRYHVLNLVPPSTVWSYQSVLEYLLNLVTVNKYMYTSGRSVAFARAKFRSTKFTTKFSTITDNYYRKYMLLNSWLDIGQSGTV